MEYRGVKYTILARPGPNKWVSTIYPKIGQPSNITFSEHEMKQLRQRAGPSIVAGKRSGHRPQCDANTTAHPLPHR